MLLFCSISFVRNVSALNNSSISFVDMMDVVACKVGIMITLFMQWWMYKC